MSRKASYKKIMPCDIGHTS